MGSERKNFDFLPVVNFALGHNEFKAIKVCELVQYVAKGQPKWPTFRGGYEIMWIVEAYFDSLKKANPSF